MPKKETSSPEKGGKKVPPIEIFRLMQNSRRIPPSVFVQKRDSFIFRLFIFMLNKILLALSLGRGKKQNIYDKLANTIDELEGETQEADKKLAALKNRAKKGSKVSKSHERK